MFTCRFVNVTLNVRPTSVASATLIVCTILLSFVFFNTIVPLPFTTSSLNVTEAERFTGVFVVPFAGINVLTVGGIRSTGFASMVKSSIANPSSEPLALKSFQRIRKVAPEGIDRPRIV